MEKSLFFICVDCFDRQKNNNNTTTENKQTNKQTKINKKKMGIIVPIMYHYPRNRQEADPKFSTR